MLYILYPISCLTYCSALHAIKLKKISIYIHRANVSHLYEQLCINYDEGEKKNIFGASYLIHYCVFRPPFTLHGPHRPWLNLLPTSNQIIIQLWGMKKKTKVHGQKWRKRKKNEKGWGHECHFLILMINFFFLLYIHENVWLCGCEQQVYCSLIYHLKMM